MTVVSERNRLEISWANALGGSLGAVSSAVVLSSLGTAGTLIGAALGSLVITIGGAVYSYSLRAAHERLRDRRWLLARGMAPDAADAEIRRTRTERRWQVLGELPWTRIAVVASALFVLAMGVVVAFELTTGRPVSTFTGGTSDTERGTSVPGLGDRGDAGETDGGEEDDEEGGKEGGEDDQDQVPPDQSDPPATDPAEPTPSPVEESPQETVPTEPSVVTSSPVE